MQFPLLELLYPPSALLRVEMSNLQRRPLTSMVRNAFVRMSMRLRKKSGSTIASMGRLVKRQAEMQGWLGCRVVENMSEHVHCNVDAVGLEVGNQEDE